MIELLNMDCMEYMKGCKDKEFSLAICDPPYGIKGDRFFVTSKPRIDQRNGRPINTKKKLVGGWDNERPSKEYFTELQRVSKNQIIWGGNYFADLLPAKSCWVVWDKVNGLSDQADCELAWTSFDTAVRQLEYLWTGLMQGVGVVSGRTSQGNKILCDKRIHPTQKPVELYKWLLTKYAKAGDKILDTHLGSGSIAIACHDYGFDLTGCEIDSDYYNAMLKRFNNHKSQIKLFTQEVKK